MNKSKSQVAKIDASFDDEIMEAEVDFGGNPESEDVSDGSEKIPVIPSGDIWSRDGNTFWLSEQLNYYERLPIGVYQLCFHEFKGYYLKLLYDNFKFPYKIYGTESSFLTRVKKTYENTIGNVGLILNGLKGTGKTVTAKQLCNVINMPIIIIEKQYPNCHLFVNTIKEDVVIFIDEYEKIFEKSSDMLTIMDGAINSKFRRLFLLTTNSLHVNENLIQRPGRIRYIKTFNDLGPDVVEEVVDDLLKVKKLKKEVIEFISNLESITIDIIKSVIQEVNIHNETPNTFSDIFNVKKITGKFDLYLINPKDRFLDIDLFKSFKSNIRNVSDIAYSIEENGHAFNLKVGNEGYISLNKEEGYNTFEAVINFESFYQPARKVLLQKLLEIGIVPKNKRKISEKVTVRISESFTHHRNYSSWGDW